MTSNYRVESVSNCRRSVGGERLREGEREENEMVTLINTFTRAAHYLGCFD